ncbi:hypothetical protein MELA_01157 [Candidatus Methylomirabilis lanthanidiphila]|uniref:DUF2281 domain-containing protein n=1 Tax=Candidatus Methylomirabilis lanthanidiphila TaxID=2211376 RepID=A0A564ZHZ5_9BACT|nr:DUF2281 domain-containing protein [Candidatus Methylomirabilis lanthanidiphila]VUZ84783.1 hypothetical protein MELA_01157 [Candidatus Methylomirabilis lanthanidiphila]
MTTKEKVAELIERLPEELLQEVQHYAEYLYAKSQGEQWSRISLAQLGARYEPDEAEYARLFEEDKMLSGLIASINTNNHASFAPHS